MSLTSLFLAPADSSATAALEDVRQVLDELAIIAAPLGRDLFLAGAGFSRQIVFAGCSPHLVMQPPADGSRLFCHVALHGPFEQPLLVTGPNTVKPRCPSCRARFNSWREQIDEWRASDAQIVCPSCLAISSACALDWRDHAACGRVLIEMRHVFPGEATPSDQLMKRLADASGIGWRYAWAGGLQDPGPLTAAGR